ncbi:ABC transporter ATP-binding protein [Enterococcus dongliensis]|uniref:ABC transporter ATP-binding protein n=1 Tax=Enterococcus dongliensis TaxID=2559925 RepID=A0AAP5KSY5_9ENTE|nr:ABC transporter ATP-binding protein [Enterococcus dongliensis]MDT2597304.1 ABC transporter ATP-binding protein [Enterococcus dongliensis]MDT2604417.1 ABC transporter ATP-binding protein [Enterococcus dongliensis]MDT2635173.1 ABC transporter ATP-binding protein [Enterococcus dongliensis]MDT2637823.1 ABC transporter ATP-binding protein [Enterococcus dongliensis]MDT2643299.1 ABC transporter ATP-binding protein [Enterococcus dongliensis]
MKILAFEHVQLIRQQTVLLQDINWHINSGEDWAILGLNGAGKSLMLNMISGNLWPSKGRLTVLGEVFGETSIPDLTKRIGWVSQSLQEKIHREEQSEYIVLSGKFASIGIYQMYSETELAEAKQLLCSLGAEKLIGKTFQILSQGEKQIVLIARALMAKPELLILDEPCNGMDLFAREDLLARIQKMKQAADAPSLLYVTHHTEEILPFINHLLMIRKGQVFKQGHREELLKENILNEFYQRPIAIHKMSENRLMVIPK